jgi:hypothetical protein
MGGKASVTIDGEAVVCDDAGVAVFEKLHSRAHDSEAFLYREHGSSCSDGNRAGRHRAGRQGAETPRQADPMVTAVGPSPAGVAVDSLGGDRARGYVGPFFTVKKEAQTGEADQQYRPGGG